MKGFRGEWLQDKSVRAKVGRCKRGKGERREVVRFRLRVGGWDLGSNNERGRA